MSDAQQLLRMLEPAVRPIAAPSAASAPAQRPVEHRSFDEMLRSLADRPVTISAEAQQALAERDVRLTESQMQAIRDAMDRAELADSRQALAVVDTLGLVLDVPGRTVARVVPPEQMQGGVVTQIDSAVMLTSAPKPETHRLRL